MGEKFSGADFELQYNYFYIGFCGFVLFSSLVLSSFLLIRSFFLGELGVGVVITMLLVLLTFGLFLAYQFYFQSAIRLERDGLKCPVFFKLIFFGWQDLDEATLYPYSIDLHFRPKKIQISLFFFKNRTSIVEFIQERVGEKNEE